MHRHHSPRALDHELHEKTAGEEKRGAWCENPERNQQHTANRRQDDHATTSPVLRQISDDRPAANHADCVPDRDLRRLIWIETTLLPQIRRIVILSPMRPEIERR